MANDPNDSPKRRRGPENDEGDRPRRRRDDEEQEKRSVTKPPAPDRPQTIWFIFVGMVILIAIDWLSMSNRAVHNDSSVQQTAAATIAIGRTLIAFVLAYSFDKIMNSTTIPDRTRVEDSESTRGPDGSRHASPLLIPPGRFRTILTIIFALFMGILLLGMIFNRK